MGVLILHFLLGCLVKEHEIKFCHINARIDYSNFLLHLEKIIRKKFTIPFAYLADQTLLSQAIEPSFVIPIPSNSLYIYIYIQIIEPSFIPSRSTNPNIA